MRCKACDTILEGTELTLKDKRGVHYDLCGGCLSVSLEAVYDAEDANNGIITFEEVLTNSEDDVIL